MFRVMTVALLRRELSGTNLLLLPACAAVGVGAALLSAHMRGAPVGLFASFVANFEIGLSMLLALLATFRIAARVSEDHASGWIVDWCGNGGRREYYVLALGTAVAFSLLLALVAGIGGHAITRGLRGMGDAPMQTAASTLLGTGRIIAFAAFGLLFASAAGRLGITLAACVLTYIASPVIVLTVVVVRDLPDIPQWTRFTVLQMPPLNATGTNTALLRQLAYVIVACSTATLIARRRIGRVQ
jgi:hypothetical protein